jgi:hypothetical protein
MATLFLLACALCAGCGKSDSAKLPSQRPAADSRGETRLWGVTTRIQGAELGPYRLEINNHLATLHAEGVVETFDLQKESWTNDETGPDSPNVRSEREIRPFHCLGSRTGRTQFLLKVELGSTLRNHAARHCGELCVWSAEFPS